MIFQIDRRLSKYFKIVYQRLIYNIKLIMLFLTLFVVVVFLWISKSVAFTITISSMKFVSPDSKCWILFFRFFFSVVVVFLWIAESVAFTITISSMNFVSPDSKCWILFVRFFFSYCTSDDCVSMKLGVVYFFRYMFLF